METKRLITITNKDLITDLREDIIYLYPLKSFCVGYPLEFDIEEINDFVLVNRILDDNDLDTLANILKNANIKGIVFDDLGIIDVVKDLNITKILLLDHLATNTISINYYLEYVDSVIVSNDLTEQEIRDIVKSSNKPLVVNVFGLKTLMYSRRLLLTNYHKYHNLKNEQDIIASIDDKYFRIVENAYGTKFYTNCYYDATRLLDLDNVLYFWYDPLFLDKEKIREVVLNNNLEGITCDSLFLDKATVYKVGDLDA